VSLPLQATVKLGRRQRRALQSSRNNPTDPSNGPLQPDKLYRFADLKRAGFVEAWNTLKNWIENFDAPPGRLCGHTRIWTGAELNAWFATRPTARLFQNREVA
jgi:hypothetical protein